MKMNEPVYVCPDKDCCGDCEADGSLTVVCQKCDREYAIEDAIKFNSYEEGERYAYAILNDVGYEFGGDDFTEPNIGL